MARDPWDRTGTATARLTLHEPVLLPWLELGTWLPPGSLLFCSNNVMLKARLSSPASTSPPSSEPSHYPVPLPAAFPFWVKPPVRNVDLKKKKKTV